MAIFKPTFLENRETHLTFFDPLPKTQIQPKWSMPSRYPCFFELLSKLTLISTQIIVITLSIRCSKALRFDLEDAQ